MPPLFGILLLAVVILGGASFSMLLVTNRKKQKNTEAAFTAQNASPNVRIQELWIDTETKKWTIAKESSDVEVHAYSSIDKVELVYDGESYAVVDGVLKSQLSGLVFNALSALVVGERKKTHMTGNIYIHIYLDGCAFPLETIVVLGSRIKTESLKFRKIVLQAEKYMKVLNAMKDGTYSGEESEQKN